MPDSAVYEAVEERLRSGYQQYRSRPDANESDIRNLVISPVLDAIGYNNFLRRAEWGVAGDKPDEICYTSPEALNEGGSAALILEAKNCGRDFDKAAGRAESPDRQVQRYLKQHPSSGSGAYGVLTDGLRWRVYRRVGAADIELLPEYDFGSIAGVESDPALAPRRASTDLREFIDTLCRECIAEGKAAAAPSPSRARNLLNALDDARVDDDPALALREWLGAADLRRDLGAVVSLEGVQRDAHDTDWAAYAFASVPALRAARPAPEGEQPALLPADIVTAAVRFTAHEKGLRRADAALCARTFARATSAQASVVLAWQSEQAPNADGDVERVATARFVAYADGKAHMTEPFNPATPRLDALKAVEGVLAAFDSKDSKPAQSFLAPLEVAPLRQKFYRDVDAWARRHTEGKDSAVREAVLRHLIRTMFAWIMKENKSLPTELFEQAFVRARLNDANGYHEKVLSFLFHKRLNAPNDLREPHSVGDIHDAMATAPFLNGSLFHNQYGDEEFNLPASAYWSVDEEAPGLFTILSRFHWTVDEHRPGESEQTLDPELLSNLFERLIYSTEYTEDLGARERQPLGTYYTPSDVTIEMVKDALAAATRSAVPARVTDAALRNLFDDRAGAPSGMKPRESAALASRIRELRIFDPAVGSGAFLFESLIALRTALGKLDPGAPDLTQAIIREQLHGQDVHPLAAQITRLRLFIALHAANPKRDNTEPLPNLEARIVCADTLATFADSAWRPDQPSQLDTGDPRIRKALRAVAENRAQWIDAHSEKKKQEVLNKDSLLRDDLLQLLRGMGALASDELSIFADTPLLPLAQAPSDKRAARVDARLLFYEEPWRGFDVVIGNPPYEKLSKSKTKAEIKALGDSETGKRYRTTNCGDLYTLFCETALALAKPEGGVVALIVPLSIAFGQAQASLRQVFEDHCASISLRHYDNRPDPTFNASPTVLTPENVQRASIVVATLGAGSTSLSSTGLQRHPRAERSGALGARPTHTLPTLRGLDDRLLRQWPKIPTPEVARLIEAMAAQSGNVSGWQGSGGFSLAFPRTTGYFLAVVPPGVAVPRSEGVMGFASEDHRALVMAALNSHLAYAWWRVFGDGFHVNEHEVTSLPIPDQWRADPEPATILGRRLLAVMPDCVVEMKKLGRIWRNVDFHTHAPDLVAEADRLYIEALGLPLQPLLAHLRTMRAPSSWRFPDL